MSLGGIVWSQSSFKLAQRYHQGFEIEDSFTYYSYFDYHGGNNKYWLTNIHGWSRLIFFLVLINFNFNFVHPCMLYYSKNLLFLYAVHIWLIMCLCTVWLLAWHFCTYSLLLEEVNVDYVWWVSLVWLYSSVRATEHVLTLWGFRCVIYFP